MRLHLILLGILLLPVFTALKAQQTNLTLAQQMEDFEIFVGGLKEGHSGLNYFIDQKTLSVKCDSIRKSFEENASIESYYLKLRYIVSLLCHGHTRINLPTNGWVNYKMGVLDSTKIYLPFEFLIINTQLFIKEDCSKEQLFPKYSEVKSIDNINVATLINSMLQFIPADGVNQTFKYYNLYNYFYFHYLYDLFYPGKKAYKIELKNNNTHYYIQGLKASSIDSIYRKKNNQSISTYGKQLDYTCNVSKNTGYLKIGSFYKVLIENFGQKYEPFLDSAFADIKSKNVQNLIIDLRNNEGGGDSYDNILVRYLIDKISISKDIQVPGRVFQYKEYAVNLTDDVKGFIENPTEFLRDDSTLFIKEKYVNMMTEGIVEPPKCQFNGNIIVLTNGGSFSAATNVISTLYNFRKNSTRKILFVGEEQGGDIYCGTECAGQGYTIKLPNSSIQVDMPFLCFGILKKEYPKKRLPDFLICDKIRDLKQNKDTVLAFAINLCEGK
jgi:Peptidase family S41